MKIKNMVVRLFIMVVTKFTIMVANMVINKA